MSNLLGTERLTLRPWRPDDAEAAFGVFGSPDVARWLTPALPEIVDAAAMGLLIEQWLRDEVGSTGPVGRWAIELRAEHRVVGGVAALYLPPGGEDVEIGVQLAPEARGRGFASEAGHRVAHHALSYDGVDEVFSVVRPANTPAAALAERIGMEWVGETDKYYGLRLRIYRLQVADLDRGFPEPP